MKHTVFFLGLVSLLSIAIGTAACGGGGSHPDPSAPFITTNSLPTGTVGVAYSSALHVSGGTAPYHWSVIGTLPSGLSFSTSGAITGVPAFAGTASSLFFQVTDSTGAVASATFSINITAEPSPPSVVTTSLPAGTVGAGYSWALQATGGTTPYTWELKSGSLPSGLSLSAGTGAITGIPSTAGTSNDLVFQVTDGNKLTAVSSSLGIVIDP